MMRTQSLAAAVVLGLSLVASPLVAGAQTSKVPDAITIDPVRPIPLPTPTKPVPEPAAIALFTVGLGVTALALRRAIRSR